MPCNQNNLAQTTAWANNCAFHCLTHFLADELESLSLQDLEQRYSSDAYQLFLKVFAETYKISKVNVDFLRNILKQFPNPIDREAIFGPILRTTLSHLYKKNVKAAQDTYEHFLFDALSYINNKNPNNPSWINANNEWLENIKTHFASKKIDIEKLSAEELEALQAKIKIYWRTQGFNKYLDDLGDFKYSITITADDFHVLANAFDINLIIYANDNFDSSITLSDNQRANRRVLTVYNKARHWSYEAHNSALARAHNQFYEPLKAITELENSIDFSAEKLNELLKKTGVVFKGVITPRVSQEETRREIITTIQAFYIGTQAGRELEEKKENEEQQSARTQPSSDKTNTAEAATLRPIAPIIALSSKDRSSLKSLEQSPQNPNSQQQQQISVMPPVLVFAPQPKPQADEKDQETELETLLKLLRAPNSGSSYADYLSANFDKFKQSPSRK